MNNLNKFGLPQALAGGTSRSVYEVPTDFVDLPSQGKFYAKDSPLYGLEQVEIKYMTAKEEDYLMSPALQKSNLAIDRVIDSLLVDKRIKAKDLLVGDKTAVLLNIRKNAFGDDYEFSYNCTNCGEENREKESFANLKIKEIKENESCSFTENGTVLIKLPKSNNIIEMKFLKGEEEAAIEQVVQKRISNNLSPEALITRYRFMIVSINGNPSLEGITSFIETMPVKDSLFLRTRYSEMNPNISFNYSSECKKCGFVNEGGVPIMADFFWPKL